MLLNCSLAEKLMRTTYLVFNTEPKMMGKDNKYTLACHFLLHSLPTLHSTVLDHRRLFRWIWRVVVFFYDGPRAKQRTHGVEKGLIKHFSTSKKMFLSEKWSGGVNFYYSYPLLSNLSRQLFMWFFSPSYPLHIWPGGKMRCKWYPRYCFLPLLPCF